MKKFGLSIVLLSFFISFNANAQEVSYFEEVKVLGIIAGQGLACEAERYDTFEMLARTILVTKATSDSVQEQGMRIYNNEKANTYISKKMSGGYDCQMVKSRFNNQEIFGMTVYRDGTIKMPDGQIYTPRTPYDATLVYGKNSKDKEKSQNTYDARSVTVPQNSTVKTDETNTAKQTTQQAKPNYVQPESSVGHISRKKR